MSFEGYEVRLWNLRTGEPEGSVPGPKRVVRSVRFSPDGRYLAIAASGEGLTSQIWEVRPQRRAVELPSASCVTWSPDGKRLLLAGDDATLRVFETGGWQQTGSFSPPRGDPWRIALSPDGRILATTAPGRKVLLWDLNRPTAGERKPLAELVGDRFGAVRCVAFSANGKTLAAGCSDGIGQLWDVATRTLRDSFQRHRSGVEQVVFSANGEWLASCALGEAKLWSPELPGRRDVEAGPETVLSPDRRLLVSLGAGGGVQVTDLASASGQKWTLRAPRNERAYYALKQPFTRDGRVLYGALDRGALIRWDLRTRRPEVLKARAPAGTRLQAVSADGRFLVCTGSGKLAMVDSRSGKTRLVQDFQEKPGRWLLSPGGRYLLASDPRTGRDLLWTLASGRATRLPYLTGAEAFSPDDRLLIYLYRSKRDVVLREVETGRLHYRLRGHTDQVDQCAFSRDGRYLATGGQDKTVRVWDLKTGQRAALLQGHTREVRGLALSGEGRTVASFGEEGQIRVWNVSQNQELLRLPVSGDGELEGFGEDGSTLAFREATPLRQLRIWRAAQAPDGAKPREARVPAERQPVSVLPRQLRGRQLPGLSRPVNLVPYRSGEIGWTRLSVRSDTPARAKLHQVGGVTFAEIGATGSSDDSVTLDLFDVLLRHGRRYLVQFRARADRARPVTIQVRKDTDPHSLVGLDEEVDLNREWRAFRFPFTVRDTAGESGGSGRISGGVSILAGAAVGRVEVADLRLMELPSDRGRAAEGNGRPAPKGHNLLRMNLQGHVEWKLAVDPASTARAAGHREPDGALRVDVRVPGSARGDVMLQAGGVFLAPSEAYVLQFRARAKGTREVKVHVQNGDANPRRIGPSEVVTLAPDWRPFRFRFKAADGDLISGRGSVTLQMGSKAGTYWITDAVLVREEPERVPDGFLRSAVQDVLPDERLIFMGSRADIPPREAAAAPEQIDLSAFYNASLKTAWHGATDPPENDLRELPTGLRQLAGTLFDVRGIIQVSGRFQARNRKYPQRISRIPVQRGCRRVDFLVGAGWPEQEGAAIGHLTLHFAGGRTQRVPLLYGRNIREWWDGGAVPKAQVAWEGGNGTLRQLNPRGKLRLYKITAENDAPGEILESIGFESAMTESAPFLIAVTLE